MTGLIFFIIMSAKFIFFFFFFFFKVAKRHGHTARKYPVGT